VPLRWELRKFWCKRRAQLYRLLYYCRNHLFLTASHLFLEEACDLFLIFLLIFSWPKQHLFLGLAYKNEATLHYIYKVYVILITKTRQLLLLRKAEGQLFYEYSKLRVNKTKSYARKRTVPLNHTILQLGVTTQLGYIAIVYQTSR